MQAIIDPSLIFTDINLSTQTDLFRFMADVLQQKKYIEKPFLKAVIQREARFPTGMQLQDCGVAIPHTDPQFIKRSFIFFVRPQQPLLFHKMEDPQQTLAVSFVLLLGLDNSGNHLKILQRLMTMFQKQALIQQLLSSANNATICYLLQHNLITTN